VKAITTIQDLIAALVLFLTETHPLKKNPGPRSRSKYEKYTIKQEAASIRRQHRSGGIVIDCDDLREFDDRELIEIKLLDLLEERPALFREAMTDALDNLFGGKKKKKSRNRVYPTFDNVPAAEKKLDTLRGHNVSEIVEVTAQVVAVERNTPHALNKTFRCNHAGHVFTIPAGIWDQKATPKACKVDNCKKNLGYQYLEDESEMFDVQWIKLKEQFEPAKK